MSRKMTKMLAAGRGAPGTGTRGQGPAGGRGRPQVSTTGNTALWPSALGPSSCPAGTGGHAPAHRVCLQGTGEGQDGLGWPELETTAWPVEASLAVAEALRTCVGLPGGWAMPQDLLPWAPLRGPFQVLPGMWDLLQQPTHARPRESHPGPCSLEIHPCSPNPQEPAAELSLEAQSLLLVEFRVWGDGRAPVARCIPLQR